MRYPKVKLEFDEPVVVAQAEPSEKRWGHYQFCEIFRLGSGDIYLRYHNTADSATTYGSGKVHAVSNDEGETFVHVKEAPLDSGIPLPNGDRIRQILLPALDPKTLKLPEPVTKFISYNLEFLVFNAAEIPKEYSGYTIERLAKGDSQWRRETKYVTVPHLARLLYEDRFPLLYFERMALTPDGRVLVYTFHIMLTGNKGSDLQAVFYESRDCGKTFSFLSAIPYKTQKVLPKYDPYYEKHGGFTEPGIAFMPDGSLICLLRTENGYKVGTAPQYICRSTDGGKSWSDADFFDSLGVWPDLVTLKNGVTLACYGRPGFFVRATSDPSGRVWDDRTTVIEPELAADGSEIRNTCGYGGLLALGDDTALLTYSHFKWPNPDGIPVKTILVRKVRAVTG
jgi:hypothetical protein